ncbi:MAG: hypothetical protein AB7G47_18710 [Mycolicibacterium sp.]|uniref:hypothetical protein n=1 Tax=Mycolicibacterium sp. TaxID=2320850 RepID=UPI003D0A3793
MLISTGENPQFLQLDAGGCLTQVQANWPQYRSQTAAGWLMSIVTQAFALIRTG